MSSLLNETDSVDSNEPVETLRKITEEMCKKIHMGAAVMPKPLQTPDVEDYGANAELRDMAASMETPYARVLKREFNAVVVEHDLKWAPLLKQENILGTYDFRKADVVVDWALSQGMEVKGHVLIWHVTSPKCLQDLSPSELREHMKRHIFTVMGYYRGRIQVWDVVNEALAPDGSLADNVFLQKLGPSYIEESFRWAHEADPTAILLYNDNKVEGVDCAKSDAFYNLLADLKAKGVPVHGCGLQAHFNAAGVGRNRVPTPRRVKEQIRRLGKLGLKVNISEMDVRVSKLPPQLHQTAQRQIYHDILAAALSEPAFDGIWLWGFSDRHTWVSSFYYDDEPLIFDEEYARKEAYYGVQDALSSLICGGRVGGEGVLLDADVDVNGNPWGHLWMQPEPVDSVEGGTGDARPDWEQVPEDGEHVEEDDDDEDDEEDDEEVADPDISEKVGEADLF